MAGKHQTAPSSGYNRRLRTLLLNEDYGPKLTRLNKRDEQKVLQLIDQNKGREARKELLKLDEKRRNTTAINRRARQYAKLPKNQRKAERPDEIREFWDAYDRMVTA